MGGASYTLQLSVTGSDGATGYAQIQVAVNTPPSEGSVSVSPTSGTQFETSFQFSQSGWTDDDLPLTYGFDTRLDDGTQTCAATAPGWSPLNRATLKLPRFANYRGNYRGVRAAS